MTRRAHALYVAMKGLLLLSAFALALACGCSSRGDAQPAAPPPPVATPRAPAPPDAAPPPPPPPAAEVEHTIVHGDTLDPIAQARYGSRHYSRLIALVDHVDSSKLRIGQKIALPSIDDLAKPLAQKVPEGTAALLRAHAAWTAASPGLWDEVRKSKRVAQNADLAKVVADLTAAKTAFDKAHAPTKELGHLVSQLGHVAGGAVDPEGYGLDDVDRRFAYALTELMGWVKK
jgi:hypothetical protein